MLQILQLLFLFLVFTVLTYVLQKYRYGKFISILVLLASSYESYVSIQYSKTAALVSIIGYITIFCAVRLELNIPNDKDNERFGVREMFLANKESRILIILGCILIAYGILLRDSSFYLATLFAFILTIYELFRYCNKTEERLYNIPSLIFGYFKLMLPVIMIFVFLFACDNILYYGDEEWTEFLTYNNARMQLLDYRYDLLDYSKYGEELNAMGVSENDTFMYLTWQFGDDTVLNVSEMSDLLKRGERRKINLEFIKGFVKHIYDDMMILNPLIIGSFFIVVGGLFFSIAKKHKVISATIGVLMAVSFAILIYFQFSGRWSHRVVYAELLLLFISVMFVIGETVDVADLKGGTVFTSFMVLSTVAVLLGNRFDYNDYCRQHGNNYDEFFEMINEHKDKLYVADTFTFQDAYKYDVFKTYEEGYMDNFVTVGSWFVNSPITRRITENYGYANPFRALVSCNNDVILVDNMYPIEKMKYLTTHYSDVYEFKPTSRKTEFDTYKVVRKK